MYAVPLRWCPPTNSNIDFDSSSPQANGSEVNPSRIREIHHNVPPTNNMDSNSSSPQTQTNGSEVDASGIPIVGKTCHQCHQKTRDVVATCKNPRNGKPCVIKICHKCLLNRYGEIVNEVNRQTNWMCPRCRGICNCSSCMKKRGQRPTGPLAHKAKASGFNSVSEMLINGASEDLEMNNVNNADVVPSNEATLVKEVILDRSEKTRTENSLGDMTQRQMDGPEASLASNGFIINPTT
ncbi:uncharacterized protein LOC131650608 [Vicia villosa]|uniref:uncharacterized protein LOC131650608 n=1 Tax=Vicia villosa TaxID=3911 RepID=UPI00273B7294|nr:uncharacterized protein LOC131650608 [Vicia villosa]